MILAISNLRICNAKIENTKESTIIDFKNNATKDNDIKRRYLKCKILYVDLSADYVEILRVGFVPTRI